MANRFTPAYDKVTDTAKNYKFSTVWHSFLNDKCGFRMIFGNASGPDHVRASGLDKLRKAIKDSSKDEGKLILEMVGVNAGGTQAMSAAQSKAAASVKFARHFYLQKKTGAQAVWIYAQPYTMHKWVHEELDGKTPAAAMPKLKASDEVYPPALRKSMGDGVNQALAWCEKCVAKLGAPDAATKDLIETWFFHNTPDATAQAAAAASLLDGFKKVTALLKSNNLIFSDEPIDRLKGSAVTGQTHYKSNWNDYGFVDGGSSKERLDAVYIQKAALDAWSGGTGAWIATLTIIHELTHRVLDTDDVVYDFSGLEPSAKLTYTKAIKNADSWGYFCAELNGQLPAAAKTKVYKQAANLRGKYNTP